MEVRQLSIAGAWEFRPLLHRDSRGLFLENFTSRSLEEATGRHLPIAQMNVSVSHQGVIRGMHAAHHPPGQAKYVMCLVGQILDVVVDFRQESPTFGQYDAVILDDTTRNAVFISERLGHGFQVLSQSATVLYATSTAYDPDQEFTVNALDPALDLPWLTSLQPVLSDRDLAAPNLSHVVPHDHA